jgi:N-acetylneuraminic acid mutarotase
MKHLSLFVLGMITFLQGCAPAPVKTDISPPVETTTPIVDISTATLPPVSPTPYSFDGLPAGEWVKLRGMPTARSETHAMVLNGKIYVAGGFMNGNPYPSSNAFEVYDPIKNEWVSLQNMPRKLNHLQFTAHQGKIYIFGGYPEITCCDPDGSSWVYDPATDAWTPIASMPHSLAGGMAVSLDEYIYLVGGTSSEYLEDPISSLLRYDPVADEWTEMSPLLTVRDHVAVVAYEGKIYALGGRLIEDYRSMEIYDPATNSWIAGPNMRTARAGHGATVIGEYIVVAGGEQIGVIPELLVNTVEVYHPRSNSWLREIEMPVALHGVPIASVDGVLFVLGGSSKAGGVVNNGVVWAWRMPNPFP